MLFRSVDFNKDNEIINEVLERKADRDYVDGQLANKANKGGINWYDATLSKNWSVYGDRYFQVGKTDFNYVHIFGTVAKATKLSSGDVVAVLPEGFRPKSIAVFPTLFIGPTGFYLTAFRLDMEGVLYLHPETNQADLENYIIGGGININCSYPAK